VTFRVAEARYGTLEERVLYCPNWRADIVAVLSSTGNMIESVSYSAYGVPFGRPAGDTDSDGDFDTADSSAMGGGTYNVRKDPNHDGTLDAADDTYAQTITGGHQTLGWSVPTAVGNRKNYAGYERDGVLLGHKQHVRFRIYDQALGRWLRRDPLGLAANCANLYEYSIDNPLRWVDPRGLQWIDPILDPDQWTPREIWDWVIVRTPGGIVCNTTSHNIMVCGNRGPNHDPQVCELLAPGDCTYDLPDADYWFVRSRLVQVSQFVYLQADR
jgi:RHS repeat-associated protein